MSQGDNRFYAYELNSRTPAEMPLTPAPVDRDWMNATDQRYAYRCLPLVIANQAGWVIHNPATFTAWWDGGPLQADLHIEFAPSPDGASTEPSAGALAGVRTDPIASQFGSGILTFSLPYLFRTPRAVNLWVKGPCNWFKDGAHPLEGVVETDWLPAAFTMNWKLTRPHYPVRFERGDPICMVVPVPRGLAEALEPVRLPLHQEPDLHREFLEWHRSRNAFNSALRAGQPEAVSRGWTKGYMKGQMETGSRAFEHQTRLHLKEFRSADAPDANPPAPQ
jgi:Family of unknown function (DUF6065)